MPVRTPTWVVRDIGSASPKGAVGCKAANLQMCHLVLRVPVMCGTPRN